MSETTVHASGDVGAAPISVEALESEALAFLEANATPRAESRFEWGQGSDRVSLIRESTPEEDRRELAEARAWSQKVFDAGFGWISGPPAYGGRGLSGDHAQRWHELEARYDTPPQFVFGVGLGMVAPTILAHATEEVKQRYLAPMHRGDLVGCQLFSEPGAGSDLAGLPDAGRPRRRRVGAERPEGVDLLRPPGRHRRDHLSERPRPAQAQGPHRLPGRHARPGQSRSAPSAS